MDIIEATQSRHTVREFKKTPVPEEIIRYVLEIALHAPSAQNIQPWEVTVVSGKVLEDIKQGVIEELYSPRRADHKHVHKALENVFLQRQKDLAVRMYQLMGIAREDNERKAAWRRKGFCFYDAPAAILIAMDRSLLDYMPGLLSIGAFMQNVCLAALNFGLGTCIQTEGVHFPLVIRKYIPIPETKELLIDIAIGYPDVDMPVNKLVPAREPFENLVTWYDGK